MTYVTGILLMPMEDAPRVVTLKRNERGEIWDDVRDVFREPDADLSWSGYAEDDLCLYHMREGFHGRNRLADKLSDVLNIELTIATGPFLVTADGTTSLTDERIHAIVEKLGPRDVAVLAPQPPSPTALSPLYSCLVPHGNQHSIDYQMVEPYMRLERPLHGMDWLHSPTDYARMQRALDLLQLAHTCKHAFVSMRTKTIDQIAWNDTCVWHNDIWTPILNAIGSKTSSALSLFSCFGYDAACPMERGRRDSLAKRAIMAALLDRAAVAQWYAPPGLEIHYDAWRDLAPVRKACPASPRSYRSFSARPFLGGPDRPDARCQRKMWLYVAVSLAHDNVARYLVESAGRNFAICKHFLQRGYGSLAAAHPQLYRAFAVINLVFPSGTTARDHREALDHALCLFSENTPL